MHGFWLYFFITQPSAHPGVLDTLPSDSLMRGWYLAEGGGSMRAQAPVVRAGLQLDYWEAGSRVGAARSGMEVQNHWGAVDSHVELSVRTSATLML